MWVLGGVSLAVVVVYIAMRAGSIAYFRSKREYLQSIRDLKKGVRGNGAHQ
jgi:hypothetical protein